MIFFTSDTHFGHENIIKFCDRPFKDVQMMNETLVRKWNDKVSPDDTVYHLGDVALGPIEHSLGYIQRLNGTKFLVTGNHDRNFRFGKGSLTKAESWDQRYLDAGFERVYNDNIALSLWGDDEAVLASHFPYNGDSHDGDRYDAARAQDSGLTMVHGHTHAKTVVTYSKRGTLQIHVGVDAHSYSPVSYDYVTNLIRAERRS